MAPRPSPLPVLCGIAAAGAVIVLAATSTYGIGVSSESETYLLAAQNFAAGRGLVVPGAGGDTQLLTQHAPMYALMLGLCVRAGLDVLAAARWIAALSLGGIALLAGLTMRRLSKRPWLPPLVSVLSLSSIVVVNLTLTALSEPLFLIATLAALYWLIEHLRLGDRRALLFSAAACAAAMLTRQVGIAVVAGCALALLLYGRGAARGFHAAIFTALASAPAALWVSYATLQAGNPVHREWAAHFASWRDAAAAAQTLSTWLLPGVVAAPVRFGALAAIGVWLIVLMRRAELPTAARVYLCFAAAYAATLVVARSFLDAAIPMDDRILSPLYIPMLLAAVLAIDNAGRIFGRRAWIVAPAALALVAVAGFNLVREIPCLKTMRRSGREYTSAAWQQSSLAAWLKTIRPGVPLYSNLDSAVRFLRPGNALGLPPKADARSGRANPQYAIDLGRFRSEIERSAGVVVFFTDAPITGKYIPTLSELIEQTGLKVLARGESWVALGD